MDLSIVTTCKSRLHHLKQTLPLMMATGAREIIVVDYDCPQGTAAWVQTQASPSQPIKVVQVTQAPEFNHARARNLGWTAASAPWVAFVDADVRLEPGWADWWLEQPHPTRGFWRHEQRPGRSRGTWGSCIVERAAVQAVGGYDEMLKGWGGEDDDFYHRLEGIGAAQGQIPADLMSPIDHGDEERTRHVPIGDKVRSFVVSRYYRTAKYQAMAFFRQRGELALTARQQIDAQIRKALKPYTDGQVHQPPAVQLTLAETEGLTAEFRLSKRCVIHLGVEPKVQATAAHPGALP